jgi:hypothetical protein
MEGGEFPAVNPKARFCFTPHIFQKIDNLCDPRAFRPGHGHPQGVDEHIFLFIDRFFGDILKSGPYQVPGDLIYCKHIFVFVKLG